MKTQIESKAEFVQEAIAHGDAIQKLLVDAMKNKYPEIFPELANDGQSFINVSDEDQLVQAMFKKAMLKISELNLLILCL